jgi:hypothetical protein
MNLAFIIESGKWANKSGHVFTMKFSISLWPRCSSLSDALQIYYHRANNQHNDSGRPPVELCTKLHENLLFVSKVNEVDIQA